MKEISIVSWNVNGLRSILKKGFNQFLDQTNPDVVCLQEVKCLESQINELEKRDLERGYQLYWNPAQRLGYSGVMSLDRGCFLGTQAGFGLEKFDVEGRVLIHDFGSFELLNCYFPNGGASEERHLFKMEFLARFLEFLKSRQKIKPVIITGDINIAHRDIDIHDPIRLDGESGFKPEERRWMDELHAAGFQDIFRHFFPDQKEAYSWWSYRAGARQRNKGWRIDYFIASKEIMNRVSSIQYLPEVQGSDHCPIELKIQI
jgi:exodeoxyribonuclease-3